MDHFEHLTSLISPEVLEVAGTVPQEGQTLKLIEQGESVDLTARFGEVNRQKLNLLTNAPLTEPEVYDILNKHTRKHFTLPNGQNIFANSLLLSSQLSNIWQRFREVGLPIENIVDMSFLRKEKYPPGVKKIEITTMSVINGYDYATGLLTITRSQLPNQVQVLGVTAAQGSIIHNLQGLGHEFAHAFRNSMKYMGGSYSIIDEVIAYSVGLGSSWRQTFNEELNDFLLTMNNPNYANIRQNPAATAYIYTRIQNMLALGFTITELTHQLANGARYVSAGKKYWVAGEYASQHITIMDELFAERCHSLKLDPNDQAQIDKLTNIYKYERFLDNARVAYVLKHYLKSLT